MSTAVASEVVSVLGALGLGSVLGQYLASSKDRREARARVLTALTEVEESRWAGPDAMTTFAEFQTALRKFQTAALIARLPRTAAGEYAVLAQAARWTSEASWKEHPDPDTGGGINANLADATREAARAISTLAWSWGLLHTWRWRRAKKRIDEQLSSLESSSYEAKKFLGRSRDFGFM